jgi:hypothetical protein
MKIKNLTNYIIYCFILSDPNLNFTVQVIVKRMLTISYKSY